LCEMFYCKVYNSVTAYFLIVLFSVDLLTSVAVYWALMLRSSQIFAAGFVDESGV
jgi:hypothetical protein